MKKYLFFIIIFLSFDKAVFSSCSKGNLIKCLDSVCAINSGSNPAVRCQLCGSESAGEFDNKMKSLSIGKNLKYVLSDKELSKAPDTPEKRYSWAIDECIKKNNDCNEDDATENYDKLIEQSCVSAGLSSGFESLRNKKTKSKVVCENEIQSCIKSDKNCGNEYQNCLEDSDLDKFISSCVIEVSSCDNFVKDIKQDILSYKNNLYKNKKDLLSKLINSYKEMRESKISAIKSSCENNKSFTNCVNSFCANNMKNKCQAGFEYEKIIANSFCNFHKIACERL